MVLDRVSSGGLQRPAETELRLLVRQQSLDVVSGLDVSLGRANFAYTRVGLSVLTTIASVTAERLGPRRNEPFTGARLDAAHPITASGALMALPGGSWPGATGTSADQMVARMAPVAQRFIAAGYRLKIDTVSAAMTLRSSALAGAR